MEQNNLMERARIRPLLRQSLWVQRLRRAPQEHPHPIISAGEDALEHLCHFPAKAQFSEVFIISPQGPRCNASLLICQVIYKPEKPSVAQRR